MHPGHPEVAAAVCGCVQCEVGSPDTGSTVTIGVINETQTCVPTYEYPLV